VRREISGGRSALIQEKFKGGTSCRCTRKHPSAEERDDPGVVSHSKRRLIKTVWELKRTFRGEKPFPSSSFRKPAHGDSF